MGELTRFLLQFMGSVFFVIGVGLLFNGERFTGMMKDLEKQPVALYLSGFMALLLGVAIILKHNLWGSIGEVIVSVFGWVAFAKGVFLILSPQSGIAFGNRMMKLIPYVSVVWLVLACYMIWLGFWS